jgi:heme/copper-type cytochrome/quinol oxidase subunit 2
VEYFDILTEILPEEVYKSIIISGVIYFLLVYYGTKQWGKFSDFDKVVFSIISGTIVFYCFVFPLVFLIMSLNIFSKNTIFNDTDLVLYSNIVIFFIIIYLSVFRFYNGNKPLRHDKIFLNPNIFLSIIVTPIVIIYYILLLVSMFTIYKEIFALTIMNIFISLPLFLVFHLTFTKIFSKKEEIPDYLKKEFFLKPFILNNKKLAISFMVIISISAALIGMYGLNTTYELVNHNENRLEITDLDINRGGNITISPVGNFYITQIYRIKYQFIPWVKITSNISLVDSSGKPYTQHENYSFNGKNDVIISNSRWSTINASLIGIKPDNLPRIYTLEKKEVNETHQIWNISFTNPYEFYIKIYRLNIVNDEKLKLNDYKINNLDFDKEKLDESIKNPVYKNIITINDIGIWGKNVNPNQSISLFFEINNAS